MGKLTGDSKTRIQSIDLLRCFAICCVILVHVTEEIYTLNLDHMLGDALYRRVFITTCFTIGRLGVPIFLFISGYLLLDKDYDTESCKRFWKRNLLGLFITTEIWIVLYSIFYNAITDSVMEWGLVFRNLLFVADMPSAISHMWYMYAILGIYIFVPFIAMGLRKFDWQILRFPYILAFCFLTGIPTINVFLNSLGLTDYLLVQKLDLSFAGGAYGLMFLTGYLFKKGMFRKIKAGVLILIGAASFVFTIWIQFFAYNHGYQYNVWYTCAFLIITCICIFELVSRREQMKVPGWIINLARCSFGIYLIHYPVRRLLIMNLNIQSQSVKTAVVCVLTLAISWVIIWAVGHLPKISKVLFYYK